MWAALLARLHPAQSAAEFARELDEYTALPEPYVGFLALDEGRAVGMIDARVRNYAEGSPNLRAAYVEDLWVDPEWRRRGIARSLLDAVEAWARAEELDWIGSDIETGNVVSAAWHRAAGFDEVERLTVFGKPLD